jgi:cbb3-type cytochrome oxidase subunit 3
MTTVQVNGDDIMAVIHVARIVGSIVMMLVVGLLIWWAVRPSRRVRRDAIESDAADNETMWRIVDRMEERLEVLERALADQVEQPRARAPRREEIFAPADEGRDSGRTE